MKGFQRGFDPKMAARGHELGARVSKRVLEGETPADMAAALDDWDRYQILAGAVGNIIGNIVGMNLDARNGPATEAWLVSVLISADDIIGQHGVRLDLDAIRGITSEILKSTRSARPAGEVVGG